ncbi:MAG: DUF2304 domain-containing protein [Candidatus Andersenbacteria bacterium]
MINYLIFDVIPLRVQVLSILFSGLLLLIIVHLIRRGYLKEGYSIIWILLGLSLVVLSIFARLLEILADLAGIDYSPTALFLILIGGLFLLAIHFSILLTGYDKRIRDLAQEHAILKEELKRQKK